MNGEEEVVPGLAEAVEQRMAQLGLTPTTFAAATGRPGEKPLTTQGLAPIRKGYRRDYQAKLKLGVCHALRWTPDSVDRLLRGEPPVELTAPSDDDRLSRIEARQDRWEALLRTLLEQQGIEIPPEDEA